MLHKEKQVSPGGIVVLLLVVLNAIILKVAFVNSEKWYWFTLVSIPAFIFFVYRHRKQEG